MKIIAESILKALGLLGMILGIVTGMGLTKWLPNSGKEDRGAILFIAALCIYTVIGGMAMMKLF